jgi:predicted AAA+ superfamily ATPase
MIPRRLQSILRQSLASNAAVALLGPRQVGKTTLAFAIREEMEAHYLDLENRLDSVRMEDFQGFYSAHGDRLLIIDEVQRQPGLFRELRGVIDARRREGRRTGLFLLLGSASHALLAQTGESLAGRIRYLELGPVDLLEQGPVTDASILRLWLRGGFPESLLAGDDATSLAWRDSFIRTYLERDIPQLGPRLPATTLARLWTMLAHQQGGMLNMSQLARSLDMSVPTIARYIDLMADLFLLRRLQPYAANIGKRLVRTPKVYLCDSGIAHALLHIPDAMQLAGHPASGGSWEGFVLSNTLSVCPSHALPYFYRSAVGEEIDLVLEMGLTTRWAVEIKRSAVASPSKGFYRACADIGATERFLVHGGTVAYTLPDGVQALPLSIFMERLLALHAS